MVVHRSCVAKPALRLAEVAAGCASGSELVASQALEVWEPWPGELDLDVCWSLPRCLELGFRGCHFRLF